MDYNSQSEGELEL